jgi:hypothetical protein
MRWQRSRMTHLFNISRSKYGKDVDKIVEITVYHK